MNTVIKAILKINPNAKFTVNAEDYNQITWLDGTTPISKADIEAKLPEARQVIDTMMKFLNKEGNNLDVAMFMISNLSNMDAPLRRAANLQYIADSVLGMKDIGKNMSKTEKLKVKGKLKKFAL